MIRKLGCGEAIPLLDTTVGDFWSWAYSDILNNTNRAVFAEFVVGMALGVTASPRIQWDAVDLLYNNQKIEVKSAAYVQGWEQEGRLSRISFDVAERISSWDSATDTYGTEFKRAADCYVFCVYAEKADRRPETMLDMDRWEFYVLPTGLMNQELKTQKTAALSTIEGLAKSAVDYAHLRESVDSALQFAGDSWAIGQ